MAPSTSLLTNAVTQIGVARWLESVGYSAVRAIDVRRPIEADGRVVTFWVSVVPGDDLRARVQTAPFADRLEWHTSAEYRTFVDVYDYDIMQWSGYSDLADIREIAMTSWLSKKAGGHGT